MKTLFLLLLSFASIAQPFNYKGSTFMATVYPAGSPTCNYVICYPGSGESYGPSDGSRLPLASSYGYAKYCKAGKLYPFNVVTVQAISTTANYSPAMGSELLAWAENIGAKQIVLMGWSLGGREMFNLILKYQGRTLTPLVKGIVAIAGTQSGTPDYENAYDIPFTMICGFSDTNGYVYSMRKAKIGFDGFTRTYPVKAIEIPAPAGHSDAMNYAYDIDNFYGSLIYADINSWFYVPPIVEPPIDAVKTQIINGVGVITGSDGKTYSFDIKQP